MTSIKIIASGASVSASLDGKITSGMIGIPVNIEYDDQWAGMNKTAFFKVGKLVRKRDAVGVFTTVPWEVLRKHGAKLEIGLEGRDADNNVVMPTIWCVVGTVHQGAQGDVPAAPNPGSGDNEPTGGAVIDDSQVSLSTTWSSKKIDEELKNAGGGISNKNAVLYTEQELTPEQQAQARANIGAANASVIGDISSALDHIIELQEELIGA